MNTTLFLSIILVILLGVPAIWIFVSSFLWERKSSSEEKKEEMEKVTGVILKIKKQEKVKRIIALITGVFILLSLMSILGDPAWQKETPLFLQIILFIFGVWATIYGLKILFFKLKEVDLRLVFLEWKEKPQQPLSYLLARRKINNLMIISYLILVILISLKDLYPGIFKKWLLWVIFILGILLILGYQIYLRRKHKLPIIDFDFFDKKKE